MVDQFGTTDAQRRFEIIRILKDEKILELHEIARLVAKRTNAKNIEKDYPPEKKQHDSPWVKRIKFDISWLQFILLDKGRGKLSEKDYQGSPLFIKKIPVNKHPNLAIRTISDKSKAYFQITDLGKEVLKFMKSYKKSAEMYE